jgi:hypothetical protein
MLLLLSAPIRTLSPPLTCVSIGSGVILVNERQPIVVPSLWIISRISVAPA